mgnify:CR=1 FL=1
MYFGCYKRIFSYVKIQLEIGTNKTNACSGLRNELYLYVSKIIFGGVGMAKGKRAESRCRYLVRDIAGQKGWQY